MPHHHAKVYIPDTARHTQYLLAELQVSQALLAAYDEPADCYRQLSQQFFRLCQQQALHHVSFIANDKLPVVRFHPEAFCFQTTDQILFFYNPQYHEAQHSFIDPYHRARKISLLFLATGAEVRQQAARFHQQVLQVVRQFQQQLPVPAPPCKIRDHQHLSYDLFARQKGCDSSFGYKLRDLSRRYQAYAELLPDNVQSMNYAVVSLPFSRKIKQVLGIDPERMPPWSQLYVALEQRFSTAMAAQQLHQLALVADGTTPLVRSSQLDKARVSRELRMLNFDLSHPQPALQSYWQPDLLPDTLHLVIVASQDDRKEQSYAQFLNRLQTALQSLGKSLTLQGDTDDCVIRFHQQLSYLL